MKRGIAALTLAAVVLTMLIAPDVAMAAGALTKQDFVYTCNDETDYALNMEEDYVLWIFYDINPPNRPSKPYYFTTNRGIHESDTFQQVTDKYGYAGIMPYQGQDDVTYQLCSDINDNDNMSHLNDSKYYVIYTSNNLNSQIVFYFNESARVNGFVFSHGIAYDDIVATTGSGGETVKQIQQKLIDLGYLNDVADGKFGKKTADAVRTFQVINGLDDTGEVGAIDYDVMFGVSEKLIALTATPAPTKAPLPTPEPGVKPLEITLTELRERLSTQTEEYGGEVGELKQLGGNAASFTVTTERLSDCKFIVKYDKNEVLQYVIADLVDVADGEIELEDHMSELGHIIGAIDPLVDGYDGFYILTKSVDEPYQQSGFVYTFDVAEEKLTVYIY